MRLCVPDREGEVVGYGDKVREEGKPTILNRRRRRRLNMEGIHPRLCLTDLGRGKILLVLCISSVFFYDTS